MNINRFASILNAVLTAVLILVSGCDSSKVEQNSDRVESAEPLPVTTKRVGVSVTSKGYEPSSIETVAGVPLVLTFKRTSDQGCGSEVVFPEQDIRRELPLNQEIEVTLTPVSDEPITFTCGMGMMRGTIVASR